MAKNLLIVESPAKAKTIEKILGRDFEVKSCFGHIRDLSKDDMGIDLAHNYAPRYVVSDEKQKVVSELRSAARKSDEVWLATDEDREGEAISWHLCEVLGLDPASTKRIVFHEITKPALQSAVSKPRTVNMDLVNAQQARRVLDRIVGFELSPVLWRKMSAQTNLSAGRVQSVAVRLIAEREREINAHTSVSKFGIEALFSTPDASGQPAQLKADGTKFDDAASAEAFLESCKGAAYTVTDLQVKPTRRSPAAPFTTSTLQQEASRKLGYNVSRTMLVAQKLYENGHITYMRTDAVNLSQTALDDIEKTIKSSFGNRYHNLRRYKNKNASAQEAHEAIRPTYMDRSTIDDADGRRLYELIWKRTMASQMADAELEKTVVKIDISTNRAQLTAEGEIMKFEGFMKVYREDRDEEEAPAAGDGAAILPPLRVGQKLDFVRMKAVERFNRPLPRYTEASLVKKLEELGIGRPSTYAPTISTIQKRGYVERRDREGVQRSYAVLTLQGDAIRKTTETENTGAEKSKLFPTDLGLVVTDFLKEHFDNIMDYGFTARMEEAFDEVSEGKRVWSKVVDEFYHPFKEDVDKTMNTASRISGERELGTDPASGRPIIVRMGRYGPMAQIGVQEEEEKPRYAKLKPTQSIETITLQEALDLFKLPLTLGEYEGLEVSVAAGRFGPYVKWGDAFVSLPKGMDPLDADLDTAIRLIREKQTADAPVAEYKGLAVTKGKGRFGPFIKWNELFVNVPKAYDFDHLTETHIRELLEKKEDKEANRFIQQWPAEKIWLENGRWGPFIRFGKKMLKSGLSAEGKKWTPEEAAVVSLEEVKKAIEAQVPGAFSKKAPAAKKATKGAAKSAAPRKKKS